MSDLTVVWDSSTREGAEVPPAVPGDLWRRLCPHHGFEVLRRVVGGWEVAP